MIQTILTTALSAQLILKSSITPTPQTPESVIERVLKDKNDVTYAVEQNNTTYTLKLKKLGDTNVMPLPALQKTFEDNNKLSQPSTDTSSSSDTFAVVPTITPTAEPTPEPNLVEQPV